MSDTSHGWLVLRGASGNNLRRIDVAIPRGLFTCVTGVSGSGKSTLVQDTLFPRLMYEIYGTRTTWDATTFTKNRQRLIESEVGQAFLCQTVNLAEAKGLTSDDRFVVDGTLIKAYAGMKSFKKDKDDPDDFTGTTRSNRTHRSTTDPDARLMRKGKGEPSMLCYLGSLMMDAQAGLVRAARVSVVGDESEVDAALAMAQTLPGSRPVVAADKGYDCGKFRKGLRDLAAVGHPVPKAKGSSVDGRSTRHESYQKSLKVRPSIEKLFGWLKQESRMRQTRFRGLPKVGLQWELAAGAYNILRMANQGV